MELIEKLFKPLILVATLVWFVLAAFRILPVNQLLIYVGVLSILMGLRNLVILNISQKSGKLHDKIQFYVDQYGLKKGLVRYAIMLIGVFGPSNILSKIFGESTTGAIYSFGYTLLVGVIGNFIMGVFCSRLMIKSLSGFKPLRKKWLFGGADK